MGINIAKLFQPRTGAAAQKDTTDIMCAKLDEAAAEYHIRELAFWTCVNFVANAIGRCEIRTYREHTEIKGREYYLWNVEPNRNQNSTAFWHKTIAKLFEDNEALIISARRRDGMDAVYVADEWAAEDDLPDAETIYTGVVVNNFQYDRRFYENEVIHLKLNHADMRPVIRGIYLSYYKLVRAAMDAYTWENGQHWKVHVSQIAQGSDGWAESFQRMLEAQVKPFLQSKGAILPEFDGYEYENVGVKTGNAAKTNTRDIRAMIDDILVFTARAFGIADVLIQGTVESTGDAWKRTLTTCIDPICDQIGEEITRKRYGFDAWVRGSFLRMDSSTIQHFDLFGQAANIEKLLGSGWTLNDIRRAAGETPINEPWADTHFITKNFAEMASLGVQEGGERQNE